MSGSIAPVSAAPMTSAPTTSTTSSSSTASISSSSLSIGSNCPPPGPHGPKPHHGLTKEGAAFLALLALAGGKKNKDKEMSLMEKLALLAIAMGPKEHHHAAMQQFNSSLNVASNTEMVTNSGVSAVSYTAEGTMNASAPTGALYSASV